MKAFGVRTLQQKVKNEADKYLEEEYRKIDEEREKIGFAAVQQTAPNLVRQTEAMFLYALSRHGYGEKRLNEIHGWFRNVIAMPDLLGKTPKATDCMKLMQERFNIDFTEINPRMQSWEEFHDAESR